MNRIASGTLQSTEFYLLTAGKIFLLSVVSLVLLGACSSSRGIAKSTLAETSVEHLFGLMKANQVSCTTLTASFSSEYRTGKTTYTFNGQMRFLKDSMVWISLSPGLGIEAVRAIISSDSLKGINRLQNTYIAAPVGYLAEVLHPALSFDLLQAMLLGNDLSLPEHGCFSASIDKKQYKLTATNRRIKKMTKGDTEITTISSQQIWLDPETHRIKRVVIRDKKDKGEVVAEASYSNFTLLGQSWFPVQQKLLFEGKNTKIRIWITFSRLDQPASLSFPFSIPANYSPALKLMQ